ncbi:MAG: hypothetical protein WC382_08795 [Methanoregulaceae archaeon]
MKVDLFCEGWQIEKLNTWEDLLRCKNSENSEIFRQNFPLKWSNQSDYYGEWLLNLHDAMDGWDLDHYDLILSDNYVEPLLYSKNVLLCGSFLWHDILATSFPTNDSIQEYYVRTSKLLKDRNPSMIVNKYFVMKSVLTQVNSCKVGIIHFHTPPTQTRERLGNGSKNILIALGNAELTQSHLHQLREFIATIKNSEYTLHITDRWREYFLPDCGSTSDYSFGSSNLHNIDIAIIRGGIGTISDCIAAKIPMIYVHDENPEVKHNQECLRKMNIGIPLSSINNPKISPLMNDEQYRNMEKNFSNFDLNGVEEASDIIKSRILR